MDEQVRAAGTAVAAALNAVVRRMEEHVAGSPITSADYFACVEQADAALAKWQDATAVGLDD